MEPFAAVEVAPSSEVAAAGAVSLAAVEKEEPSLKANRGTNLDSYR